MVFGGPSIDLWPENSNRYLDIRTPVQRGDLDDLINEPDPGVCIIIDGVFGGKMAITPTECRELLEKGWLLMGSSSMGALRAADLWSLGMIGIGDIYNDYRLSINKSDGEVAVVYDQNTFEEKTISLVHIKAVLDKLCCNKIITIGEYKKLLAIGKNILWFERFPAHLEQEWKKYAEESMDFIPLFKNHHTHPKKLDAAKLLNFIRKILPF